MKFALHVHYPRSCAYNQNEGSVHCDTIMFFQLNAMLEMFVDFFDGECEVVMSDARDKWVNGFANIDGNIFVKMCIYFDGVDCILIIGFLYCVI